MSFTVRKNIVYSVYVTKIRLWKGMSTRTRLKYFFTFENEILFHRSLGDKIGKFDANKLSGVEWKIFRVKITETIRGANIRSQTWYWVQLKQCQQHLSPSTYFFAWPTSQGREHTLSGGRGCPSLNWISARNMRVGSESTGAVQFLEKKTGLRNDQFTTYRAYPNLMYPRGNCRLEPTYTCQVLPVWSVWCCIELARLRSCRIWTCHRSDLQRNRNRYSTSL